MQNGRPIESSSAKETLDVLPHEASFADLLNFIENFLVKLPNKKRDILLLRFGGIDNKPLTLEEVGYRYELTRERIRQIQSKTLKILKDRLGDHILQKISHDCLTAVCPFTPQLLLRWAGETKTIQYQPAFYVRMLEELSSEIPGLPEGQIMLGNIAGRFAEIRREIKEHLAKCDVPEQKLANVFNQIKESSAISHFSEMLFLESIRFDNSLTLNLDIPDKPVIKLFRNNNFVKHKLQKVK